MRFRDNFVSIIHILIALVWLSSSCVAVFGQAAARPDRGIMPVGSYSVSDIETVNATNGNVHISIPLAKLPPMASGKLSAMIVASYDSKLGQRRLHTDFLATFMF